MVALSLALLGTLGIGLKVYLVGQYCVWWVSDVVMCSKVDMRPIRGDKIWTWAAHCWWTVEFPCLDPISVWPSEVRSAHLSVKLDSKDVAGVTVVADLRPLLEVVDVHALRHGGAHHNYQTAREQTLHDVDIWGLC